MPLVTVLITTARRPELVRRAVRSALAQTVEDVEVIVVVDGPDAATLEALAAVEDARLRVVPLPENVGFGAALNAGVREAASRWVALLDDDDEWLPCKLEAQLRVAERSSDPYPLVTCRLIARSEAGDVVWPLRTPDPGEPLSEYLFCQRGLRGGEGVLLPSTLFAPKALFAEVPFRPGLPMLVDVDWLLRAVDRLGVRPAFVPEEEPLAVWHMEEGRPRMSDGTRWRWAMDWIRESRGLVTPRAYAGYLLTTASFKAARSGQWRAFWRLPWEAFRGGRPNVAELCAHVLIWTLPKRVRNRIVVAIGGRTGVARSVQP